MLSHLRVYGTRIALNSSPRILSSLAGSSRMMSVGGDFAKKVSNYEKVFSCL